MQAILITWSYIDRILNKKSYERLMKYLYENSQNIQMLLKIFCLLFTFDFGMDFTKQEPNILYRNLLA